MQIIHLYLLFMYLVGPKILYEQEHNAEQLLVKNFTVKVRLERVSHYDTFRNNKNKHFTKLRLNTFYLELKYF